MNRREFLTVSTAVASAAGFSAPNAAKAADTLAAPPMMTASWRRFEIVTDVDIWPQDLPTKLWRPMPLYGDTDYQRTVDVHWSGNADACGIYRDPTYGAAAFFATWTDRTANPNITVPCENP